MRESVLSCHLVRCPVHDLYPNQHIDGSRPRTTLPRPLAPSGSSLLLLMVPINGGPPLRRSAATTKERPNMHLWGSGSKSCNGESLTRSLAFRHFWANIPRTRITRPLAKKGARAWNVLARNEQISAGDPRLTSSKFIKAW